MLALYHCLTGFDNRFFFATVLSSMRQDLKLKKKTFFEVVPYYWTKLLFILETSSWAQYYALKWFFYLISLSENWRRAHMAINFSYLIECCSCTSCLVFPSTEGNVLTYILSSPWFTLASDFTKKLIYFGKKCKTLHNNTAVFHKIELML